VKVSAIRAPKSEPLWRDLADYPGVSVLIVPSSDLGYRQANTAALQPHARQVLAKRFLDPAVQDGITASAVASSMLHDWKNVEDEEGQPVPFSRELAVKWAADPVYSDFFGAIAKEGDLLAEEIAAERKRLGNS